MLLLKTEGADSGTPAVLVTYRRALRWVATFRKTIRVGPGFESSQRGWCMQMKIARLPFVPPATTTRFSFVAVAETTHLNIQHAYIHIVV